MKMNLLTFVIAGLFVCGFTACSNSEAVNTVDSAFENESTTEQSSDEIVLEAASSTEINATAGTAVEGAVRKINTQTFINEIFDYNANPKEWVYKGTKPAIIDFYADWCGPCKMVAPIMDELALKYKGQVNFYKINTDEEKELSGGIFGIRSIPSILYIPVSGQPRMSQGLSSKEEFIERIESTLLNKI